MVAYVLDSFKFNTKDILEFEIHDFKEDINFADKSSITVARKPNISKHDFVYCKDGNKVLFIGVCDSFKTGSNQSGYVITMRQKECLFDRDIFVSGEELISQTGIEDFIVKAIEDNFSNSGDSLVDRSYISVSASTHTPISAKVDADDGVFNLKTYIGNARQYYGVFLDFTVENGVLGIDVSVPQFAEVPIDIGVSDVSDYTEVYEVSVLAKLNVKWKIPDAEDDNGNTIVGALTSRCFYLLADRTITEDSTDSNRASGAVQSVYIEAETEEEMLQEVYNNFTANKYNHKISFGLSRASKLYPEDRFFVGRKCLIKTKTGIQSSMITKSEIKDTSATRDLVFGNLRVTLIDKIRGERT